jgi:hypothetical protein
MKRGKRKVPEFPEDNPEDDLKSQPVRLKKRLWDRLTAIAEAEGKSRNRVVEFFLEWAADDWEQAQARKHKK